MGTALQQGAHRAGVRSCLLLAVWNRACVGAGRGVGDRHLSALLLVDGMVQNGGANHAADGCEPAELAAAAAAGRCSGLDDLAAVVEELLAAASDCADEALDERPSAAYHHVAARRRRRTSSRV